MLHLSVKDFRHERCLSEIEELKYHSPTLDMCIKEMRSNIAFLESDYIFTKNFHFLLQMSMKTGKGWIDIGKADLADGFLEIAMSVSSFPVLISYKHTYL